MDPIPCACCNRFFVPRNKRQQFCSKPECQRTRKSLWQKHKLATDPEYKKDQQLAHQKWLINNPDYWRNYRQRNPDKAERNRALQRIRNQKTPLVKAVAIAKMDVRTSSKNDLLGLFWLVPAIAKMDPIKIFITTAPGCSG